MAVIQNTHRVCPIFRNWPHPSSSLYLNVAVPFSSKRKHIASADADCGVRIRFSSKYTLRCELPPYEKLQAIKVINLSHNRFTSDGIIELADGL